MEHGNKNKSRPLPVKQILHLIFAVNQGRKRPGFYTAGDQLLWIENGKTEDIFKWEENKKRNPTPEGPEPWDHHRKKSPSILSN